MINIQWQTRQASTPRTWPHFLSQTSFSTTTMERQTIAKSAMQPTNTKACATKLIISEASRHQVLNGYAIAKQNSVPRTTTASIIRDHHFARSANLHDLHLNCGLM